MKSIKFLPQITLIILAVVFVWLNNFGLNYSLKQNKVTQPTLIKNQKSILRETARVLRVVDGDTIEVSLNGKTERARLIGIDSPEVADERKPIQCFGKEAAAKAREVLIGKTITLESDPTQGERDEYGRLLRYVFLDSLNFDELMISEGFAREYTFKGKNYKYQTEFIQAEKEAEKNKKGLWSSC